MVKPKPKSKKKVQQHAHLTGRFHIDRRAGALAATTGHDDDLLTTAEVAEWLQVSTQWLEIGRAKNYGPAFQRLGPALIRYRRAQVREWLREREFKNTAEYSSPDDGRMKRRAKLVEAV